MPVNPTRLVRRQSWASVLVLVACVLAGCDSTPAWEDPAPEDVFERFLLDWFMGKNERAYQQIAPEDREVIERAHARLKKTMGDKAPSSHELLAGSAVSSPYGFKKVERLTTFEGAPKAGQKLELGLSYLDGREGKATLVWDGERWFVDLPLGEVAGKDDGA